MPNIAKKNLAETVRRVVDATPVTDVHTHVYDAALGPLLLWGIDELFTSPSKLICCPGPFKCGFNIKGLQGNT